MGGKPAPRCRTLLRRGDGRVEDLPSKLLTHLDEGDVLEVFTTGGGGYGDPLGRDPERVLGDVLDGRVSVEGARRDYGVVVDAAEGRIDRAATESLRGGLRAKTSLGLGGEIGDE